MDPGAHHPASLGEQILSLKWTVANFSIFAFFLTRALRGPIREFFRQRTERLRDELAAGARARKEAEALRAQLAKDLADLPGLRERLRADMRASAERERDQLLASARQSADRIRRDAQLLAEQEATAARRALRAELVEDAVRAASALVTKATGADDQQRFVREFVAAAREGA
jgi:F-type H+-transporting ATPase subunit b